MRALITGAGGFVGGYLAAHLISEGDEVIGSDRAQGGPDICDAAAIASLVRDVAPEVIYHLAGQPDVAASWRDPIGTFRVNAEGSLNVLSAAFDTDVARVVMVSSAEVYGLVDPAGPPVTEERPLDPSSPYAASKAAAEMIAIQWSHRGLGVVRARAFNHLGPGQSEAFVAPAIAGRLARAIAAGDDHIKVGNLTARRDFTDVRDVVRAYRSLALSGVSGDVYNICSGRHWSIAELVDKLVVISESSVRLVADPSLQRPSDLALLVGDPAKIADHTGWSPSIPFEQTLVDLFAAASAATQS